MVFLGVVPRNVGVALAEDLCDLGGSLRLKASVMGRRTVPHFGYALALALQLRKSTENLSGQPNSHRITRCADLAVF
jgi:hypothetical protein